MFADERVAPRQHAPKSLRVLKLEPAARLGLICFPCAGASASSFLSWRSLFGGDTAIVAVQLPGREERLAEGAPRALDGLAAEIADDLRQRLPGLPLAFFGHSFGALLAFETAHRLLAQAGRGPRHLFLAGRAAPHLRHGRGRLSRLGDRALIAEMRRIGFANERLLAHAGFMHVILRTLRADLALDDGYACPPRRAAVFPVTAFSGADDPIAPPDLVAGWQLHAGGGFAHHTLPAQHFFLQSHLPEVVALMRPTLAMLVRERQEEGGPS